MFIKRLFIFKGNHLGEHMYKTCKIERYNNRECPENSNKNIGQTI